MLKYTIKRILQMFMVMLIVSLLVFMLTSFLGDPVNMLVKENASAEEFEAARARLGLDKPFHMQYLIFLKDALKGELGISYSYGQSAMKLILERVPATLEVVVIAFLLTAIVAIPCGVYAGAFPQRKSSKIMMSLSILGISLPTFWIGMMFIFVLAVQYHVLPASGRGEIGVFMGIHSSVFTLDGLRHLIMPSLTLALAHIASTMRLTRSGVIETMKEDYIKFVRAKGVRASRTMFRHALKNALIPVITVMGLSLGGMIAFTTITETIFAWPGMGKLLIDSINKADRPVIVAYLMVTSALFVVINFVVDILYSLIDPRITLR